VPEILSNRTDCCIRVSTKPPIYYTRRLHNFNPHCRSETCEDSSEKNFQQNYSATSPSSPSSMFQGSGVGSLKNRLLQRAGVMPDELDYTGTQDSWEDSQDLGKSSRDSGKLQPPASRLHSAGDMPPSLTSQVCDQNSDF